MGLATPLGSIYWIYKTKKIRFFDVRHLMSHREKGVLYIGIFYHSIGSQMSFKPLKLVLSPPVVRKSIFWPKSDLIPEFATL